MQHVPRLKRVICHNLLLLHSLPCPPFAISINCCCCILWRNDCCATLLQFRWIFKQLNALLASCLHWFLQQALLPTEAICSATANTCNTGRMVRLCVCKQQYTHLDRIVCLPNWYRTRISRRYHYTNRACNQDTPCTRCTVVHASPDDICKNHRNK